MKYRAKANKSYDKKKFSKTADWSHKKNFAPIPMRGGIRL